MRTFPLLAAVWLAAGAPLSAARPTPRLLATADDFARIDTLVQSQPWAASVRSGILQSADAWPAAQNQKYGLSQWQLPPEGGQWTLWYVCPVHGVSLQMRAPGQNLCRVDQKNYTGWPYDQVIYSYRHSDNAAAARDSALTYRLRGDLKSARAAAQILLAYADTYATYPLKDVNNRANTTSGARVMAQTLDEAIWLIPMAWAYDLISDSGVLSLAERAHVEQDLLRAAVAVILRNDAKTSNWQSWHNAAVGAVGFALDDAALIARAIDGASGFRFQMKNSVLGDGAWFEGAWGYHFYALDAHTQLAEMAARAGIDLWAEKPLRRMFECPLEMANPHYDLPPFNDSGAISLFSQDRLFEMAYARYADPLLAGVLGRRTRGREALFWGSATVPDSAPPAAPAAIFPDSGNAVLRAEASDHYIAMKFGPHGGGHGHYDKLGLVSYARGAVMAVDPGTQSYAAPTHNTWDKVTLAHNTMVVDETTQAEATGELRTFAALPSISAVRAGAGPVYKQASLERALILAPEYAIDAVTAQSLDGAAHRFDWIYHNYGRVSTPLALAPAAGLPAANGYQHLSSTRSAVTDDAWTATFDVNDLNATYGSYFSSPTSIGAAFSYSREQSAAGSYAGRMSYDFTPAQGYVVYSTPALTGPSEVPARVSLQVYGDNSGHRLVVRLYDRTDERFVYTVGAINWTGWKKIEIDRPAGWQHYLGNDDGVFDPPVHTVGIELDSVAGAPLKGAIYVDDIVLEYPSSGTVLVESFERTLRSLRVSMLGAPGTTVITGDGLGPDLLQPVPFVMARRRGASAQFYSLLEPYGEAPRVTAFQSASSEAFAVKGDTFDDRVSFDAAGALRYLRRSGGGEIVRLGVANAAELDDGFLRLLQMDGAAAVEVGFADGGATLSVTGTPAGRLRIYAPQASTLTVNGRPAEFTRDGAYLMWTAAGAPGATRVRGLR